MMQLFKDTCYESSKLVTQNYSTSFSMGIKALGKRFHQPIYGIYGFVRFADEIVDTFHDHNKAELLQEFKEDAYKAIDRKISLNPILNSFQEVVHQYGIENDLIEAFLFSMEMDLQDQEYTTKLYDTYIYGSAEVVGLMCLRVFCENDNEMYQKLVPTARKLGSAFQKVNFLRDLKSDSEERGRMYFPNVSFNEFNQETKVAIEADIAADFAEAYIGILQLPEGARFGVYTAYRYYLELFKKIQKQSPNKIISERIRVPNPQKFSLLFSSYVRNGFNML